MSIVVGPIVVMSIVIWQIVVGPIVVWSTQNQFSDSKAVFQQLFEPFCQNVVQTLVLEVRSVKGESLHGC